MVRYIQPRRVHDKGDGNMRFGKIYLARLALFAMLLIIYHPAHAKIKTGKDQSSATIVSGSAEVQSLDARTIYEEALANQTAPNKIASTGSAGWQLLSTGGLVNGTSADYIHSGTMAQTATGTGFGGGLVLKHGFWQEFSGSSSCCDVPGDANGDGSTDVGDAVYLISHVFKGGPPPECSLKGDANGDCSINLGDAVFLVSLCFNEGVAPICGCQR